MVKPAYQQPIDKVTYEATLGFFDALLKLLHPYMPFITEELWQATYERAAGESLMTQLLPEAKSFDAALIAEVEIAKEIITGVRNVRAQKNIPNKEAVELEILGEHNANNNPLILKLSNLSGLNVVSEKSTGAVSFLVGTSEYAVPLGNLLNVEEELKKLNEELVYQQGFLVSVLRKLSNEKFVANAKPEVVDAERKKQSDAESKIKSIEENIASFSIINRFSSPDMKFLYLIEGYRDASFELLESVIRTETQSNLKTDSYILPIYFLYRHYLELILKDIIRQMKLKQAIIQSNESGFKETHSIKKLWGEMILLYREIEYSQDRFESEERIILKIEQMDSKSTAFRYPFESSRDGEISQLLPYALVSHQELKSEMTLLSDFLEGIHALASTDESDC